MSGLDRITLIESEVVDGVIPHGGKNDEVGVYLCPECLAGQHEAWLTFWEVWHKDNGYSPAEFRSWARSRDLFAERIGWVG